MIEHEQHPTLRPKHWGRCQHRLINIEAIVSVRVEGGYKGRCLLCGMIGPARSHSEAARRVLLDQLIGAEE